MPNANPAIPDNGDSDLAPFDSSPLPLDTAPGQLDEHRDVERAAAPVGGRTEAAGGSTRH